MRRTDDGIDPLEVADGGKEICKTKYTRIPFFLRTEILWSLGEELQRSSGQKLKDVLAIMQ